MINKIKELLQQNKLNDALDIIEQALKTDTYNYDILFFQAEIYKLKQDYEKAALLFREISEKQTLRASVSDP